jgi:hypothetical protein
MLEPLGARRIIRRGEGNSAAARPWSLPEEATRRAMLAMFLSESAEKVLLVIRGECLAAARNRAR